MCVCVCRCVCVCEGVLQMLSGQPGQAGEGRLQSLVIVYIPRSAAPTHAPPPSTPKLPTPPSILTRELRQSSSLQKCFLSKKMWRKLRYSKSVSSSCCFNPWIKRVAIFLIIFVRLFGPFCPFNSAHEFSQERYQQCWQLAWVPGAGTDGRQLSHTQRPRSRPRKR